MSYHGRFEQAKQPKQPGKKKGLKIFLIVIAVILALLLILAGAAYLYLQSKLKKMISSSCPRIPMPTPSLRTRSPARRRPERRPQRQLPRQRFLR